MVRCRCSRIKWAHLNRLDTRPSRSCNAQGRHCMIFERQVPDFARKLVSQKTSRSGAVIHHTTYKRRPRTGLSRRDRELTPLNAHASSSRKRSSRSSIRITCGDCQFPPRAVGIPASFRPAAMVLRLVFPAARSSLMIGARSRPRHAPSCVA